MARPPLFLESSISRAVGAVPPTRGAAGEARAPDGAQRELAVLLVVTDGRLRGFLHRLCERRGHAALLAAGADDGLRLLAQLPAPPDVVLLDGALAVLSSGRHAPIGRFLSTAPTVPLVVIGGRARDVDIPRLTVHPSAWIPAPFDGEALIDAVERVANTPSLRRVDRPPRLA
ncbi:MAG: hypothetical protein MUE41_04615 [Gemmatimonadaceae bacterium]|jgi:DNA-binding response OmpR family regulator|nr:hypothetical protein [Gemmatimonadaceae bacterium]